MSVPQFLLRVLVGSAVLAACGSPGGTPAVPGTAAATSSAVATPVATASARPRITAPPPPSAGAICAPGTGEVAVYVDARSNLFGAGADAAPGPGGGGGGALPPAVAVPAAGGTVVTFPCTGGLTDCCSGTPTIGPAGFLSRTDVESHGGIAGLVVGERAMFLAGVFIGDEAPAGPAPERLDLSGKLDFERLEPGLAQTFFIGDGAGKVFVVPPGATRLFLGFVDAAFFVGEPGYYGNNRGGLEATVRFAEE